MGGFIQDFGAKLIEGGYTIFPMVPRSKRPAVRWKDSKIELDKWLKFPLETGIAINAKSVHAVDVDVRDQNISKLMYAKLVEMFGKDINVRVGEKPKFLIPFKVDQSFKKKSSKKYSDIYGLTHQIEILGDGQYFVAFGIHPKTEKNFIWKTPLSEISIEDLPVLTEDLAQEVIDYFEEIRPADWEIVTKESSTASSNLDNPLLNVKPKTDLTVDAVIETVNSLDPDIDHGEWVRVGMGLFHEFSGDDEGFNIWNDWSQGGEKYDPGVMCIKWDSFKANLNNTNPVTFSSVIHMAAQAAPEPVEIPLVGFKSLADLATNIGSVKWLVKGWLEASTMSCVFGDPGSYKSFVAIDQACCIATGTPWQGCEVDQGTVLYIAGEGHGGLGRRVAAWCKDKNIKPENVPVYFSTAAADMYNKEAAVDLTVTIDALLTSLSTVPKLIVYDTLARNMGAGDENSTSDMNTFINHIDKFIKDRYDSSVMLVHHTGHKDKQRARGSSAFLGALDHSIRCQKNGRLKLTISCNKMKDAEEPDDMFLSGVPIHIGDDDDGEPMDSLTFHKSAEPVHSMKALTTKQADVIEVIKRVQNQPGEAVARLDLYRALEDEKVYVSGRRVRPILEVLASAGYIKLNDEILKLNLEVIE